MSPEQAIAMLDRALERNGAPVVLRRTTGTQQLPFEIALRARLAGYEPRELVGPIRQGDSKVILSPTEMQDRRWPWPPRADDKIVVGGKVRNVVAVEPFSIGTTLVRLELQVRG